MPCALPFGKADSTKDIMFRGEVDLELPDDLSDVEELEDGK